MRGRIQDLVAGRGADPIWGGGVFCFEICACSAKFACVFRRQWGAEDWKMKRVKTHIWGWGGDLGALDLIREPKPLDFLIPGCLLLLSRCNEMAKPQKPGDPSVWSVYAHCDHLAPVTQSLD